MSLLQKPARQRSALKTQATILLGAGILACVSFSESARAEGETTREIQVSQRSWLYLDDAVVAAPFRVLAVSRVTYTSADGAARPFASDLAHPGAVLESGAEVGIAPALSIAVSGATDVLGLTGRPASGMSAGLRLAPFATLLRSTRIVASAGYLNELSGSHGAWAKLAVIRELGRARIGATANAQHVYAMKRDAMDVMVTAGASYQVTGPLRVGVEYVAQDLEGAVDPEEAEGIRHFIGPTVAVELPKEHLAVVFGPAAGLSAHSPYALGRAAIAYSF